MLRVVYNGIARLLAAESVDLGTVAGANGEPVQIGIMADRLALVEESNEALAEDIAAEVNRKLLVQIDIVAVLLQTLDTGDIRFFGGKSLGSVGSIGGPGEHGKLDCLGNLGE